MEKYSAISDDDLDLKIRAVKGNKPNDGEVLMKAHLLSEGIRVPRAKLRASIHRVDPVGTAERRSTAIKRRKYLVEKVNDVWHIDGNHKLIRWRFVIHGGIDGYSRMITFLRCHSNNKSESVLSVFSDGVSKYGLPLKVRTDHGRENVKVWQKMMEEHCSEKCIITGSSTHNPHIERLWRDVHRSVLSIYGNIFRELQDEDCLDNMNEADIYCLQYVFLPLMNKSL